MTEFICDVLRHLASACTSAADDGSTSPLFLGLDARRRLGDSRGNNDPAASIEDVIEVDVDRELNYKHTGAEDYALVERVVGIRLLPSTRRDFCACVEYVRRGSTAYGKRIRPGAVVVSVNGISMRNLVADAVISTIFDAIVAPDDAGSVASKVRIEFAQVDTEDARREASASFSSPTGGALSGRRHFDDYGHYDHLEEMDEALAPLPLAQRRRERSRSMKHFWMSDRSTKACQECEQLFTFVRRRHHCRSCGQIFCSQCCARLPQSFGGPKVDESISRLRKQLVCHTCHRQLREGLEIELSGLTNVQYHQLKGNENGSAIVLRSDASPHPQTLLLMPPQVNALKRAQSDATPNYRQLDKTEFFNKDEISKDDGAGSTLRGNEQAEKAARPAALFNMFPKVQIVASVQQLTHQPRLQGISSANRGDATNERRRRSQSLDLTTLDSGSKESRKNEICRTMSRVKRSNSLSEIGNPSSLRWDEKVEFDYLVDESSRGDGESPPSTPPMLRNRPKALSGTFTEPRFGSMINRDPFVPKRPGGGRIMTKALTMGSNSDAPDRSVLSVVGLSDDASDDLKDPVSIERRAETIENINANIESRIEERIFNLLELSPSLARLPLMEQHRWMQTIKVFSIRAAQSVKCKPEEGDSMDVMEYVRIKCLEGGRIADSFPIDGVLVHKSLARKGMRSDIENPRILLIASDLDYQRRKEAIASLESVAQQEVEYMHIVAEKIMTMHPDIVMFSGHVHRVAEELLFKEGVAVIKNVRMVDMQRVARTTSASLLTSYDHVDKISDKSVIGTCKRFYVLISDYEPKSMRQYDFELGANGNYHVKGKANGAMATRRKRPQRQNIVFEGGLPFKGFTVCLRGGTPLVYDDVTKAFGVITRTAYNMKLQAKLLLELGHLPPKEDQQLDRSMAETWFAKCSTSLYLSLKSNSLSMRASLKETQGMCKWCKDRTRYHNISSLRVIRTGSDESSRDKVPLSSAGCACSMRSSDALRDRILFSACWSSLDGKNPSRAEMMCIDFYSANDCSVGQFLDKYCFASSGREFKRAFLSSKLSFSHDVGRITLRVKDLSDYKDSSEKGMAAAALLRELNHRAVLRRIRSSTAHMWTRSLETPSAFASRFSVVPEEVLHYSFGKLLESLLYGKTMALDSVRFPHLSRATNSRDPSLVLYFSKAGRVVSVQCEPVEPVLHVALQPVLWQDHVDHRQQLAAIRELTDLAKEVFESTTAKLSESMADPLTPLHARSRLRILRNEVHQWHSCYASTCDTNPPRDVFEKNARFKDIFMLAADWSIRITQAMHATVKPTVKNTDSSPKAGLPRAWFDQLAGAMERELSNFSGLMPGAGGTSVTGGSGSYSASSTFLGGLFDASTDSVEGGGGMGDLESLASYARSLKGGDASASGQSSFSTIPNEVVKMLNANGKKSNGGQSNIEMSDALSTDEREDLLSSSLPGNESSENSLYASNNVGASTIGSVASRYALENFRRSHMKTDPRGYLTIPQRLLDWHPSLPSGVKDSVVLVNATQPTSVVAYSLCSKVYTQRVNAYMRKESITLETGPMHAIGSDASGGTATEAALLQMLRSTRRNNVDHVFVDDNQFQQATRFSCKSYYAMQFHALRRLYYGGDRNYLESLCHCEQWNAAGGKSGAGFLKTRDQRFIAKAIPEIELQMFLSMANEYFGYMAKTFEDNLSSMLSKVLGIYKVSISSETDQKMCIIVMENLIYGRDVNFSFDLKGKMEGRYRDRPSKDSDKTTATTTTTSDRTSTSTSNSNGGGPVLWDRNFIELAGGIPLPLQESAMSLLLSAIANDTAFLASVQATDYSLLVGYDVKKQEVVASIIDYIHKYDFLKMVEHAGKRLIQDEGEITVLNPRQYRRRFCMAMTKYFVTIPSRYTQVTTIPVAHLKDMALDGDDTGTAAGAEPSHARATTSNGQRPTLESLRSRGDNDTLLGHDDGAFDSLAALLEEVPAPPASNDSVTSVTSVCSNASTQSGGSRTGK